MRIIIVEDDSKIAGFVSKGLVEAGYQVDHAADAESAAPKFLETEYAAAIVDVMLPGMDGLSLVESVREQGVDTPILILSARRSVDDRVLGFQKGGDDYLTKPFSFSELLVRLQSLIRRSAKTSSPSSLDVGDIHLDLLSRVASRGGNEIILQPREFTLLEYFMRNPGRVLSKTMIMEHVWDYDFDPQTNVVDVLVSRLRSKVDREFEKKMIQTVRGVGYVLRE